MYELSLYVPQPQFLCKPNKEKRSPQKSGHAKHVVNGKQKSKKLLHILPEYNAGGVNLEYLMWVRLYELHIGRESDSFA